MHTRTRPGNVALLLAGLLAATQSSALCRPGGAVYEDPDIASTTPTADFIDHGDGTVTHKPTGLMWKRCGEGQSWNGTTCTGTLDALSWDQAVAAAASATFAGHDDWRLPNVKELSALVERRCWGPALNHDVFPGVPDDAYFWSATPTSWTDGAWFLAVQQGTTGPTDRFRLNEIRLVRDTR